MEGGTTMRSRSTLTAALVVLVGSTWLYSCGSENDGNGAGSTFQPTDDAITNAIKNESQLVPNLMDDMQISTADGVVTLGGSVPNLLAEQKVLRIARSTRGVRSVIDELTVVPEKRSDAAIKADVRRALNGDVATEAYGLDVDVNDGIVRLTGTVKSWAERLLASDIVRSTKGVVGIEDYITVTNKPRSDEQIKADVVSRLRADAWIDDKMVDVEVHDGAATLSGAVGSAEEKMRAADDVLLMGAKDVNTEQLKVEWSVRNAMQQDQDQVAVPDSTIRRAVMDAESLDPRVRSSNVETSVDNGVVTLMGRVRDLRARSSLVEDATNTTGVLGVVDSLAFEGARSAATDTLIEARVKQALKRDPYVGSYDLGVTVAKGAVTLTGTVGSEYEKLEVQRTVEKQGDVTAVTNNIDVDTDAPSRSDQEIRSTLEQELHWSPWLADADVHVSVQEGIVTIKGSVHGWFERNLLQEAAKEAGARGVLTELDVSVRHASTT
jgi:osmotically-inducible protein OsmY